MHKPLAGNLANCLRTLGSDEASRTPGSNDAAGLSGDADMT
ncbi:MAG: hypothetical protein V3S19_03675 [Gemmatimonadales bacterium]